MIKKRLTATLLTGALCLSLAACTSGGSDASSKSSAGTSSSKSEAASADNGGEAATSTDGSAKYNLSVILKTLSSEYWQYVKAGAEAYVKENPDLVSVDVKGPSSETAFDEMQNMIETDLNSNSYDGILISPLQSDTAAKLVSGTDLPIMALDTNFEAPEVISFVGTGNQAAAKQGAIAAVEAAKAAGWEEIKCIEIAGVQGDQTNTARMTGYEEGITEAGGEFLSDEVKYAEATADRAVTSMEAIMQTHPEGIAIICANNDDMAMAAARTAAKNPAYANTIFLGFNGDRAACEAILNNELTMSVAQMAYEMGYKAVESMVAHLEGETVDSFIDSGSEVVTIDTAEERLATLDKQLGK